MEILVQPAPQSQNEGYHGGSSISFLTNLGPSSDLFNFQLDPLGLMDPLGECPAVEVFKFRDKDGFFGQVGPLSFRLGSIGLGSIGLGSFGLISFGLVDHLDWEIIRTEVI